MAKRFFLVAVVVLFGVKLASAQDAAKVGPNIYKVLMENDRVRVSEITFKPGDKIGTHSHPDHLLYVLSSGKITITRPGEKPAEMEAKEGQVLWSKAETHKAKNTGDTEFRAIVVDLKDTEKK
jgi:quercetin dioxygenase-like cupin family protein